MASITTVPKCLFVLFFIMSLMNYVLFIGQARPLGIIETGSSATGGDMDLFDWLSLGAMKQSGPSPGVGHKFSRTTTLTERESTLGAIKESGPSGGGEGHKFTNDETLGGMKGSGPSQGRKGHKYANTEILGGIKDSGPSPGKGH